MHRSPQKLNIAVQAKRAQRMAHGEGGELTAMEHHGAVG